MISKNKKYQIKKNLSQYTTNNFFLVLWFEYHTEIYHFSFTMTITFNFTEGKEFSFFENLYFSVILDSPTIQSTKFHGVKTPATAKSLQSCPTLCDPIDGSPPGSPCPWDSPGKNTGVGCHFLLQCVKVKSQSEVAQSCPTARDPMDCSLPSSSIHGIFQARVLEWGAIAFSGTHQNPKRAGVRIYIARFRNHEG